MGMGYEWGRVWCRVWVWGMSVSMGMGYGCRVWGMSVGYGV